MEFKYRQGRISDITDLKNLGVSAWRQFETKLTADNWDKLYNSLSNENTYSDLLNVSDCIICTTENDKIVGMAFLVPKGNPTDIYDKDWCYIRFVSVDPEFGGQGIGRRLTTM
ncbi:GNAT family N-acetyltransferase, partial [Microcystis sp. M100S2]|uniref:GNAT family N-acetyltransferase n=1 Tax=Microcystis sp. M100S2 TaxID=2771137 RepID=UPI00258448D0